MAADERRIAFVVDGRPVEIDPEPAAAAGAPGAPVATGAGPSLLDVLRDQLGSLSAKDGCSPQGQCGCCTVLVDGQPRVACVTPVRRVAGRTVTTLDGLDPARLGAWADAFCATGASQCGFCTPGIIVRLDALSRSRAASPSGPGAGSPAGLTGAAGVAEPGPVGPTEGVAGGADRRAVEQALLAHLCRCTGWQTIGEAWERFHGTGPAATAPATTSGVGGGPRDLAAAARRAAIEGGTAQRVGPEVAQGRGGFACDTAPADALVALADGAGGWVVAETLTEARARQGKVQGRRTTVAHAWPLTVPDGDWAATLRTTWVEPAYLEPDASWCAPGGEPASALANGGAFGAKRRSPVAAAARELADRHGRAVLVLASREDATRWGPKRPPVAGGARPDGTGRLRVVATPGITEVIAAVAPGMEVEEVTCPGPPTSVDLRASGWAEALVLVAAATGRTGPLRAPSGAEAEAVVEGGTIRASVRCGAVLDPVVLRSYCIGAAHMAWSWVTSEAVTVDPEGRVADLTIRSFGVARAVDTPPIEITLDPAPTAPAVNGSDAVFAAVALAVWRAAGLRPDWPVGPVPGLSR